MLGQEWQGQDPLWAASLGPSAAHLAKKTFESTSGCRKQLYQAPGGLSAGDLKHGVVYGVVHRSDDNHNKEMVVYGWSAHQLKEEMRYIRDVRLTLERVRNKMYGEYDEMKRKIQELSSELTVSHAEQASLENHIQVHAAALESFREMSSSLTSASIELQKTLVDVTLEIRDQIHNLKQTHEQSMEKLKEKQKASKVESSQEANAEVMREMTRKLYSQYEEKLQEEEWKHKLEKETLLERHQLQKQLKEYEMQLQRADLYDQSSQPRSLKLEDITDSLRERIQHLDDMVLCQQKKVKHMVEEVMAHELFSTFSLRFIGR
ncbi:putative Hypothetical GRINL1A combined protein [Naja naja]|nr:putative Hypothetical GRINL1A combined protein [Naja naja]